jgi:hypothetical protein
VPETVCHFKLREKSMSDGGLIVLWFVMNLFGAISVIWASLCAVKRRVTIWDGNSSVWFIITIGGFGRRQTNFWKRQERYDDDVARIVTRYQLLCWLGMILWALGSMGIVMGYKALTYTSGHQAAQYPEDNGPRDKMIV